MNIMVLIVVGLATLIISFITIPSEERFNPGEVSFMNLTLVTSVRMLGLGLIVV